VNVDWSLLAAPMVAGLLVLATHVPLGIEVLRRGIIFIDLAIAQVAGLGVMVAVMLDWDSPLAVQAAAAGAALAGALLLTWTERRFSEVQEALIGLLFVVAAAAGILVLAGNPHGGEHLQDLLAGQILWVGWARLAPVAVLYAVILGLWVAFGGRLGRPGFYVLFAMAVTVSVQLVGVLLVFTSLIAPAVALRRLTGSRRLVASWGLGAVGYGAGLLASALFDLPAGAAIVCCLAGGAFVITIMISTRGA
jgi:zinc/manganese transport system permease protein